VTKLLRKKSFTATFLIPLPLRAFIGIVKASYHEK